MSEPLHIIAGSAPDTLQQHTLLPPFSEQALSFLHDLSENLLNNPDCRPFPNLAALGFWLRPASLRAMADDYGYVSPSHRRLAAGIAFHITPANVDNLFVYSWAISLLCGNGNIVRLSRHESDERLLLLEIICQRLQDPRHLDIRERTAFVSYGHDDNITIALSSLAKRRVLWGGDDSIAHLRSLPVPALSQDVVFPDRRSGALLSASAVLRAENLDALLDAFYRDSYGFNQMACSSPRFMAWLNDSEVAEARDRFWKTFAGWVANKNPPLEPSVLMDKQVAVQSLALTDEVSIRTLPDNRLQVIELDRLGSHIAATHPGGGLFFDAVVDDLTNLDDALPSDLQTLTYFGIDPAKINQIADRIVPIGKALTFNSVWDGMNLFERLSRSVHITYL